MAGDASVVAVWVPPGVDVPQFIRLVGQLVKDTYGAPTRIVEVER